MDRRATTARDAGMERIKEIDRWLVGGAVGLTVAFSAVAAHAFKGHSLHPTPTGATSSVSAPASNGGSGAGDPSGGSGAGVPGGGDPNAGSGAGDPGAEQAPVPVPSPVVTASS
jgi:hypothetical protein